MEAKLYVGNLPYSVRDDGLQDLFSQAGGVVSANVITDRESGRSKGFGFVEMSSPEEAEKAIQMFNGYSFEGRDLRVNIARPREERPRGGRDRRGGGSNRRY
jgi:RNA recognition motif-containing protein